MTILRDISVIFSLFHTLILFMILFESRFNKKKTLTLTLATMIPLCIANGVLAVFMDPNKYGTMLLLTLTLPSLVVFWIMAKNRDGRFFFTFCFADTIVLEVIYITQILNFYITPDSNIFMFVSRMAAYPILEYVFYKKVRSVYLEVQQYTSKGWYIFTAIGAIFYVAMTLMMNRPTAITERPKYIPAMALIFLLMPVLYVHIFTTLKHQQDMHQITEQENILKLQVGNITERIEQFSVANDKFRFERHDFRHKLHTMVKMIENEEYDELRETALKYDKSLEETKVKRYCKNAVVDAALAAYIQQAESKSIKVTTALSFPETLPVNDAELATVFANAIENAIHACEKLDESKRFIKIQVLASPGFMMQVSNSYDGNVKFDKDGIPLTDKGDGHGFGTRSIVAFCEKNKAYYEFKADDDVFIFRVSF